MKKFKDFIPFFFFLVLVFIFFWKFFLRKLIPIPADITVGMYHPWLDYKWGFPAGVPVKNPILTDSVSQFWIWRNLAIEALKKGNFLFWNSYAGCGTPLVPIFHSALFSPLNFFYFLFSQKVAMSLIVISQPLLALVFTYFFLRLLKLGKLASILGAVVFAFGGFMMVWLSWGMVSAVGAGLPAVLWGLEKFIKTKKPKYLFFQVAALSFSLHNAHLQTFSYICFLWFLFGLFRSWDFKKRRLERRIIFSCLAVFLLFFLFNVFVILPAFETLRFSIRNIEDYLTGRNFGFLPFSNLLKFVAPDYFGNHATGNYWGKLNYQELVCYFGLVPLVLVVLAFLKKKKSSVISFFAFSGFFFLGLALKYPFGWLIYRFNLPLLSKAPASRILFLVGFCGAVLAGFGLEEFLKIAKRRAFERVLVVFWVTILALGLGSLIGYLRFRSFPDFGVFENLKFWATNLHIGLRNLAIPLVVLFFTSVIFYLKTLKNKYLNKLLPFLLLFLTIGELFRFGWKYTPFVPSEFFFPETPVLQFLKKKEEVFRIERERGPLLPPNMWIPFGLESASAYDPVLPLGYAYFLNDFAGRKPTRFAELEKSNLDLFNLLNIKYMLALKYDEQMRISSEGKVFPQFEERLEPVFEDGAVMILENKEVWPRAFLLRKDFEDEMVVLDWDLVDSARIEGTAVFKPLSDQVFVVKTEASTDALLLVTNNYFPGWGVELDDRVADLEKTSLPFLAVLVPSGEHRLVFKYEPELFRIGLLVSVFSFFCSLFLFVFCKRRRNG